MPTNIHNSWIYIQTHSVAGRLAQSEPLALVEVYALQVPFWV